MEEKEEGGYEGIWMDREDEPPDDLRYNVEGKKNRCITWEHLEDIFEASNRNTRKVRSESCNRIVMSTTQAKPIDLSWTAHPQLRALNLRHEWNVNSQSSAK